MMLGPEGMRDLQARAEALQAALAGGEWTPNRADRTALAMLPLAAGGPISREAITEMLTAIGPRRASRMDSRLVRVLIDSAAAQDLPSIEVLPETQEALHAVALLVRQAAQSRT